MINSPRCTNCFSCPSLSRLNRGIAKMSGFEPHVPFCDMDLQQQVLSSRKKIDDSMVRDDGERVSQTQAMYALTTMMRYGGFGRGWKWSSNHTDTVQGDTPSGFQFNVSPRAPVFHAPFSKHSMFSGTMAFPLSLGESSDRVNGQRISAEFLYDSQNRVLETLLDTIDPESDLGLGDDSNFAGIFAAPPGTSSDYWCVVQCNSTALSRKVYDMILEAEPESMDDVDTFERDFVDNNNRFMELGWYEQKKISPPAALKKPGTIGKRNYVSWEDFFFHNRALLDIKRQLQLHRVDVLCKAMRCIGLGVPAKGGSKYAVRENTLASEHLVNNTNFGVEQVDINDSMSDVVYLSNLTSLHAISNSGVVVRGRPQHGLVVMPGPWNKSPILSADTFEKELSFIGVHTCTGMKKSTALLTSLGLACDTSADVFRSNTHRWRTVDDLVSSRHHMMFDASTGRGWSAIKRYKACVPPSKHFALSPVKVVYAPPKCTIEEETV